MAAQQRAGLALGTRTKTRLSDYVEYVADKLTSGGESVHQLLALGGGLPSNELRPDALKDWDAEISRLLAKGSDQGWLDPQAAARLKKLRTWIRVKSIQDEVRKEMTSGYEAVRANRMTEVERSAAMFGERLLEREYYQRAKVLALQTKRDRMEHVEQQLRMGQEQRKKSSQREFLSELLSHARDMIDLWRKGKILAKKRAVGIRTALEAREKKKLALEDREEKKRI